MKKTALKFVLCFILISTFCNAQIKILLLNGKMREVKQYEIKGDWIFYKKADDPKDKLRKLDKFNVFSALNADGTEEIIYDPDTSFDGDPSVDRVRNYIKGEQFAMENYNKPMNKVEGALVGMGSGYAGFYGPIGVFLNAIILSRFNPKVPQTTLIEPAVLNSDEFKLGYQKHARNKKIKDSLIFGGIGFSVGFAAFAIFK